MAGREEVEPLLGQAECDGDVGLGYIAEQRTGVGINTMLNRGVRPAVLLLTLGCAVLALGFLYLGIRLWPGML